MPELTYSCSKFERRLTPNKKEGFDCATCQCAVHDFRGKNEKEIRQILQQSQGRICGVFNKDQVENSRAASAQAMFKWAFVAVFILGWSAPGVGQSSDSLKVDSTIMQTAVMKQEAFQFSGFITDEETGEALPFVKVSVLLDGQTYNVRSDFDGFYTLDLPEDIAVGDQVTIVFESHFKELQKIVWTCMNQQQKKNRIDVILQSDESLMMVGIVFMGHKEANGYDVDPNAHSRRTFRGDDLRWF